MADSAAPDHAFTPGAPRYKEQDLVPDFSTGTIRFPYRREPYARVTLQLAAGGTEVMDAKVLIRTGDSSYLHISFPDVNGRPVSLWIHAHQATRIRPEESSWRDPYDLDWE